MKPKIIIVDTGPLVAFLNRSDKYHDWSKTQFAELKPPFFSCESVISEACFLLRHSEIGIKNIFQLLERELIKISFQLESEIGVVKNLMSKYKDIPMSLADACLVRMSEQISDSTICTLDKDFRIYRKDKRKFIPLIIPADF